MKDWVVYDIETCPDDKEKLASIMPVFNSEDVALGNTKDEEKIKAKIEQARLKHEDSFYRKAALSATTGRILVIGLMFDGDVHEFFEGEEKSILEKFWQFWTIRLRADFVGFNSKSFDLPFIIRRSWILGVSVPVGVVDEFKGRLSQSHRHIDILDHWMCGAYDSESGSCKLDMIARTLGVGAKNGSGKDFGNLYVTERKAALEYALNDLRLTRDVAKKMGVIK